MTKAVLYELVDHTAVITINEPDAKNSLSSAVRAGLFDAFRRFEADEVARVGVLTGAGDDAFCAGANLKEMAVEGQLADAPRDVPRDWLPIPGRNVAVSKPWLAAVNGYAYGGGVMYVLLADMAIVSSSATFCIPEAHLSRGAPWSVSMAQHVSSKIWFEMAVTGCVVDADRALQAGLVNRVTPPPDLLDAALQIAERIATAAPLTVRATRRMIDIAAEASRSMSWDMADELFVRVYESEDALEGPRAWSEGRQPEWRGR